MGRADGIRNRLSGDFQTQPAYLAGFADGQAGEVRPLPRSVLTYYRQFVTSYAFFQRWIFDLTKDGDFVPSGLNISLPGSLLMAASYGRASAGAVGFFLCQDSNPLYAAFLLGPGLFTGASDL